jgi:26S proteasome regulatory subunit N6
MSNKLQELTNKVKEAQSAETSNNAATAIKLYEEVVNQHL